MSKTKKTSWTIGRKLLALAIFSCSLLVAIGAFEKVASTALVRNIRELGSTHLPAVRNMTLTDMMHDAIRATVYKALLAHELGGSTLDEAESEYREFSDEIRKNLDAIAVMEISPEAKKVVSDARPKVEAYVAKAGEILSLIKRQDRASAVARLPEFNAAFGELETDLGALGDLIEKNAEASVAQSREAIGRTDVVGFVIIIVGVLISLVASYFVNRNLERTLVEIATDLSGQAERLGDCSREISQTSSELSSTASSQSSAIQETAASLEEITSMVDRSAGSSASLKESVESGNEAVGTGLHSVREMLDSMEVIDKGYDEIREQVEDGNRKIEEIVKVISEIGEKTKVINDIVFQTKLLSFNASVEAARAGEHGKGFAVVAEEVGNLARMSGGAAQEISSMLETGIQRARTIVEESRQRVDRLMQEGKRKIQSGGVKAQDCGRAFEAIVAQMNAVSQVSSELANAIEEQSKGLSEINKAVSQIERSNQANVTSAEASADTATRLLEQFESLRRVVSHLASISGSRAMSDHDSAEPEASASSAAAVIPFQARAESQRASREGYGLTETDRLPAAGDSRVQDF